MRRHHTIPLVPVLLGTLAAASPAAAGAAPPGGGPAVVSVDEPVVVSDALPGTDRCGRPDETLRTGRAPSVADAPDGALVSWTRDDRVTGTALVTGGQVRTLSTGPACTEPDDGRTQWATSVAVDGTGRSYLATVTETPNAGLPDTSSTTRGEVRVAVRDPGSTSFGPPVVVSSWVGYSESVDLTPHPVVDDRVWITYNEPIRSNIVGQVLKVGRTDDGGATWGGLTTLRTGLSAVEATFTPKVVVLDAQRAVVVAMGGALGAVINQPAPASPSRPMDVLAWHTRDGGATWTGPARVMRVSGDRPDDRRTGGQLRFLPTVSVAATDDGRVHVLTDDHVAGVSSALRSASSADGGATWVAGPDVAGTTAAGGFFSHDLVARPGGVLAAVWHAYEDTEEALLSRTRIAVTTSAEVSAGGAGWGPVTDLVAPADRRAARRGPFTSAGVEASATPSGVVVAHEHPVADASGVEVRVVVSRVRLTPAPGGPGAG
ncbi:MAG: hypothetical protein ACLGIR_04660 [Actinomycetes bacterium]